jgi:hypothetical protein
MPAPAIMRAKRDHNPLDKQHPEDGITSADLELFHG